MTQLLGMIACAVMLGVVMGVILVSGLIVGLVAMVFRGKPRR